MESRKNLTNKEKIIALMKWTARKNFGISIAYWILLFITFPLVEIFAIIVVTSNGKFSTYTDEMAESFPMMTCAFAAVAILFSTVVAIIAFSYMHNKRRVDLFGSLPVSRRTLFFTRYASAILLTVVPVIVIGFIGAMLSFNNSAILSAFTAMGYLILAIIGNITFVAFISLCCGTVADVIISYGVINAVWPFCILIFYIFPSAVVPGMDRMNIPTGVFTFLTPMASYYTTIFGTGKTLSVTWWIILTIALMGACFILAKKRKAETAQNAFAFDAVEVVIKFITCFVSGFGLGYILANFGNESHGLKAQYIWFYVGAVIGIMTANILLHLIFNRGLKKYSKSLYECATVLGCITVFLFVVTTGLFGYDTRIPKESEIDKVCLKAADSESFVVNGEDLLANYTDEKEIIDYTQEIHKIAGKNIKARKQGGLLPIIGNDFYSDEEEYREDERSVKLMYKLKDGSTMYRKYTYPYSKGILKVIEKLKNTEYYTRGVNYIGKIPDKYVSVVGLIMTVNYNGSTDEVSLNDYYREDEKAKMESFISALKQDIRENGPVTSFKKMNVDKCYKITLQYEQPDNTAEINYGEGSSIVEAYYVPEYYTNTMKLIKKYVTENSEMEYYIQKLGSYDNCYRVEFYSKTGKHIYFKMPEDWDADIGVNCLLLNKAEWALYCADEKQTVCEKVGDGIYRYEIPKVVYEDLDAEEDDDSDTYSANVTESSYPKVIFFQHKGNTFNTTGIIKTGCTERNKPEELDQKLLVPGEKIKSVSVYDYEKPMYQCKWEKYNLNK